MIAAGTFFEPNALNLCSFYLYAGSGNFTDPPIKNDDENRSKYAQNCLNTIANKKYNKDDVSACLNKAITVEGMSAVNVFHLDTTLDCLKRYGSKVKSELELTKEQLSSCMQRVERTKGELLTLKGATPEATLQKTYQDILTALTSDPHPAAAKSAK